MSTILSINNKLLSFRGRMSIGDENGEQLYDATGQFALFNPTWILRKRNQQIATVKRKMWPFWSLMWDIHSSIGDFQVKRKLFSWSRIYYVIGGKYDGAIIEGNFWDLKFSVTHQKKTIASAKGKILSIRDTHSIEVYDDESDSEIFTTIMMVVLQLDRRDESNNSE
ncbi:LURP-one-related family protein [Salinimonas chungwhensis]|uniref:LURP-one-related family protein n=1 Tax=Salinimonas chungwhensis TaxID=265425 RepID=UPI000368B76C|nr:LURP-one-related family protein [Salinimonas chungwhensis]